MKNIFYLLATLLTIGGAYLAYDNNNKLKEQVTITLQKETAKNNVLASIDREEKVLAGLNEEIQTAEQGIADTSASIDSAKSKEKSLKKTLAKYDAELETILAELAEFEELQKEIEIALGGIGVSDIAEIPDLIDGLKTEVQDNEDELANLELIIDKLINKVARDTDTKTSTEGRLATIRENVSNNSMVGTVTSVNSEWGFVIINKGSENSTLKENTELLVQRSGRYVGKLTIATLNQTQSICDLNLAGFRGGSLVRPGDNVILSQSVGQ